METELIIIGGGPAGMTAAIYAARAGVKPIILEGNGIGGQISFSPRVENYPAIHQISGMELSDALFEQVQALGGEFRFEQVEGLEKTDAGFVVKTDSDAHTCKAVILATGTHHRTLGVEREEELVGSGVSYCAVCDGAFFKGADVAVVGGGDTAFQAARLLAKDCNRVYLIHRRNEFRSEERLVRQVKELDNVKLITPANISALEGEFSLTGVKVSYLDGKEEEVLPVTGLFVSVGQIPDNRPFASLVDLDETGYVIAGETCQTKTPGLFVAGDCRTKQVRQLTTAAGDGAVAALAACEYLEDC